MERDLNDTDAAAHQGLDIEGETVEWDASRFPAPTSNGAADEPELDESWARVDLTAALRGEIPLARPTVLQRDDGNGLFSVGCVNGVHGDSGVGKSIVSAIGAGQEISAGRHVIWIDFEDPTPATLIERLRDVIGVDADAIAARLHYFGPLEPFDTLAVGAIATEATGCKATLLVVDSLGEAFGLEGIDENADKDVAPWMRRVARHLADAGPAVLTLDHSTKAADNPLHPSGSKRKRAAITGQSYLLEAIEPLTRDRGGKLRLKVAKDRHGFYRRGETAAIITMTPYPDGSYIRVTAPEAPERNAPDARLDRLTRAAIDAVRDAEHPVSQRVLMERMDVKASATSKRAGIEEAVARGAIRTLEGPRRALLHVYNDPDDETPDTET